VTAAIQQPLRALTIHQPWAWFIAQGYKPIENRSWAPPASIVGCHVAIHASKRWNAGEVISDLNWAWIEKLFPASERGGTQEQFLARLQAQCGHVVAVARLAGSVRESSSRWFFGPIGWQLEDVVAIEPVACRGAQGLWALPPDVHVTVRERYGRARSP
jgi:hypothetical protein